MDQLIPFKNVPLGKEITLTIKNHSEVCTKIDEWTAHANFPIRSSRFFNIQPNELVYYPGE